MVLRSIRHGRFLRSGGILFLLGVLFLSFSKAEEGRFRAEARSLASRELRVGEPFFLEIELRYPEGAKRPEYQGGLPQTACLLGEENGGIRREGEERVEIRRLHVSLFDIGNQPLGTLRFRTFQGDKPLVVDCLAPSVQIVGTVRESDAPAPPEPPRVSDGSSSSLPWVLGAAALVLLTAIAGLVWWLLRRPGRKTPLSAMEEARMLLDALRKEDLPGKSLYREHYFRASAILRQGLSRELDLPVRERTTEEVRDLLQGLASRRPDLVKEVVSLLEEADRIKYALFPASTAEAQAFDRRVEELLGKIHENRENEAVEDRQPIHGAGR